MYIFGSLEQKNSPVLRLRIISVKIKCYFQNKRYPLVDSLIYNQQVVKFQIKDIFNLEPTNKHTLYKPSVL